MKKLLGLILVIAMVLSMGLSATAEEGLKVAVVLSGATGDRSFYDSANEGLQALVASDLGIQGTLIECKNDASMFTTNLIAAAEDNDIVIAVGWEFWDALTEYAPQLPDTKFIFIDNGLDGVGDNLMSITYAQNEGSFLAGYIAAAMSDSGVVGAVGGEDSDTINDFIVGYKQGAEYYATEKGGSVKVETNYSNDYDDPAKGKECAKALHDLGADVIFQIASKAGDGVFEAAQEGGFYAIGVDSDQKYIADDVIICSMKKEVGGSIYDAVTALIGGDTTRWGSTWVADMSSGYVGIGYGEDGSTQQIPDDVKARVEELAGMIVSGEIIVDSTR